MDMTVETALRRLQAAGFAMHEAALYLDAHPMNTVALRYHAKAAEEYKTLRDDFERQWGSLTSMNAPEATRDSGMWHWTSTPWPWEVAYPAASDNPENNKMGEVK